MLPRLATEPHVADRYRPRTRRRVARRRRVTERHGPRLRPASRRDDRPRIHEFRLFPRHDKPWLARRCANRLLQSQNFPRQKLANRAGRQRPHLHRPHLYAPGLLHRMAELQQLLAQHVPPGVGHGHFVPRVVALLRPRQPQSGGDLDLAQLRQGKKSLQLEHVGLPQVVRAHDPAGQLAIICEQQQTGA
jgi:hypothetical protein